jgi:hypothetical protein
VDLKLKYIPSSLLSFEKFIQIADDYVLTPWPLGLEKKNKERERERERERLCFNKPLSFISILLKATLNKKKKERRKKKERKETDNMESQNEQLGFTNQAIIAAKILSQNSFPKTICFFFSFFFLQAWVLGSFNDNHLNKSNANC